MFDLKLDTQTSFSDSVTHHSLSIKTLSEAIRKKIKKILFSGGSSRYS